MEKIKVEILLLEDTIKGIKAMEEDASIYPDLKRRMLEAEIKNAEASLRGIREMVKAVAA